MGTFMPLLRSLDFLSFVTINMALLAELKKLNALGLGESIKCHSYLDEPARSQKS
jgi:hypothetical protein